MKNYAVGVLVCTSYIFGCLVQYQKQKIRANIGFIHATTYDIVLILVYTTRQFLL